ncbi:hypothetical protein KR038_006612 [Drosophila bunnanda]|nr:hypothetical protein KR038_006612 [Drosophila bunnanda]
MAETNGALVDVPGMTEVDNMFINVSLKLNEFRKNLDNVMISIRTEGVQLLMDDSQSWPLQDPNAPSKATNQLNQDQEKIKSPRPSPVFRSMIPVPKSRATNTPTYTPLNVPAPIPAATPIEEEHNDMISSPSLPVHQEEVPIPVKPETPEEPSTIPKSALNAKRLFPRSKSVPSRSQMKWY